MLSLDVPTMLLMTAAASLTMAASLAAVRPERRDGTGLWALGLMMHTSTYVLYALRGVVPNWASVVLANTLLASTFAMVLAAVHRFQGRGLPWRRMALPVLAMALLYACFIDDYRARIMVAGVVAPLQLGMVLWSLWRRRPGMPVRGAALLSAGLAAEVLLLAVRGTMAATRDIPVEGLMQGNAMQSITFMAAFVVVILTSLGFILMAKDRSDADNRYFAAHDVLTRLPNRRALHLALERGVERARRLREPYAVMMVDIDHFKAVNDDHGHLVGDQVLRHVAGLLRAHLRAQDLVGRYGGEEFLILLPHTALGGARELGESLRRAVEQAPYRGAGREIRVTVSIGLCGGVPEPGDAGERLIQAADQALYAAKIAGRNRVRGSALSREAPAAGPLPPPAPATR